MLMYYLRALVKVVKLSQRRRKLASEYGRAHFNVLKRTTSPKLTWSTCERLTLQLARLLIFLIKKYLRASSTQLRILVHIRGFADNSEGKLSEFRWQTNFHIAEASVKFV